MATFDSAAGYREMAGQAGQAVTSFEVGRQFVDGNTVCSIIDSEMAAGPRRDDVGRAARHGRWRDRARGELIYDAEACAAPSPSRGMSGDPQLLACAQTGDKAAFETLTESVRAAELQVHCYRIVGSPQVAEDLVQETLVAAWQPRQWRASRAGRRCAPANRADTAVRYISNAGKVTTISTRATDAADGANGHGQCRGAMFGNAISF